MTRFKLYFSVPLALMLALSSCGFQLRGPAQLSAQFNPLYLEPGQLQPAELSLLKRSLNSANAQLSESSEGANNLIVRFISQPTRNLAKSSQSGVDLVQLGMTLEYRVQSASGESLVDSRQITQTAELELDSSNVLSHQKLLQRGHANLQQNLVRSMIYQLKR